MVCESWNIFAALAKRRNRVCGWCLAHELELPFLKNSQQFDLVGHRNIPDFIEKQCTAVGELKPPDTIA